MRWYVYHENKGIIAGPFKTKANAEKRVTEMIRESQGQSLWLSVVSATGRTK